MKLANTNFTVIYLLLSLLFPIICFSQEDIVTDRPDQTESSTTVPKSFLQIESGMLLQFDEAHNFSEKLLAFPTNLFRYGLTDNFELRLANQYQTVRDQISGCEISGISDLELGFKFRIINDTSIHTELAILSHLLIPSGSKDFTNDKYGSINKIAISHDLSDDISLGYNIGYNYFGSGNGDVTYSISVGNAINDKAAIFLEYYGEFTDFKTNVSNLDAGITYKISKVFQIDFSFGIGINNTMNFLSCGFAWKLM